MIVIELIEHLKRIDPLLEVRVVTNSRYFDERRAPIEHIVTVGEKEYVDNLESGVLVEKVCLLDLTGSVIKFGSVSNKRMISHDEYYSKLNTAIPTSKSSVIENADSAGLLNIEKKDTE